MQLKMHNYLHSGVNNAMTDTAASSGSVVDATKRGIDRFNGLCTLQIATCNKNSGASFRPWTISFPKWNVWRHLIHVVVHKIAYIATILHFKWNPKT